MMKSIKILKTSAVFISSPLKCTFNKFKIFGIFPIRLKYAMVKLLLKKRDKET
jgi:hypothetical protein